MKNLFLIIYLSLTLHAGLFTSDETIQSDMIKNFEKISHNANAIVKRGNYKKYPQYKMQTKVIYNQVNSLSLNKNSKINLKKTLNSYSKIVDSVYNNIKDVAPNIDKNYAESLNGLTKFNNAVIYTGYRPLINEWNELTKIKHKFIRKPNSKLEKQFFDKLNSVEMVLLDLCVDEEEELLAYLIIYKNYFKDLSSVYKNVQYSNIRKFKPLSYLIKSKLQFVIE